MQPSYCHEWSNMTLADQDKMWEILSSLSGHNYIFLNPEHQYPQEEDEGINL